MNRVTRLTRLVVMTLNLAALTLNLPVATAADIGIGKVLAYDREAKLLVLADRSLWSLSGTSGQVPAKLSAGDRVQFSYESGEGEIGDIIEIYVQRENTAGNARNTVSGRVLAVDRKARILVLDDKSAWSLGTMKNSLQIAITAGNRVRIEYESDEQGVPSIRDIRIIDY